MNKYILLIALACGLIATTPARAEPTPGSACGANNQVIHSGGPEESGNAYWLVCQGGTWRRIISSDANGMASTNTPTAAAHIATKAYVDAQAAGSLNVYKYDGVTLIGKFLGAGGYSSFLGGDIYGNGVGGAIANCGFIWYLNPATEAPAQLGNVNCGVWTINNPVYFSGSNCTGTMRQAYTGGNYGYACTGAGVCTTDVASGVGPDLGSFSIASYRYTDNNCYNGSSTLTSSYAVGLVDQKCGNGPSQYCKVKP